MDAYPRSTTIPQHLYNASGCRYAFIAFGAAAQFLRVAGRPVGSTDFGHHKHVFFDGLNGTCLGQLGSGRIVPLASIIFAEKPRARTYVRTVSV